MVHSSHSVKRTELIEGGPYDVIYGDPPWRYESCTVKPTIAIERHYPTMELAEIKQLDIPTAKDAVLFLWTTAPKLVEALEVMKAWGFEYRTCAIWDKISLGLGHWFRIDHEILLVGRRGNYPTPPEKKRVSSVFRIKKRKHSEKPDIVRCWIEEWYPDARKIELFARTRYEGWEVWGAEAPDGTQSRLESFGI